MEVIAVDGVGPGVGKSTLAAALADLLTASGLRVDHFREEDIRHRPAFAAAMADFERVGRIESGALLTATAAWLRELASDGVEVAVADALLPYIPSLLAWGRDEAAVDRFIGHLTAILAGTALVSVYLDGDPDEALTRAVDREGGDAWLRWLISRYADVGVTDRRSLVAHFAWRRAVTLRTLTAHGWPVIVVPDALRLSTQQVLAEIQEARARPSSGQARGD